MSDEIANNKSLVDEMDQLILIGKALKKENEKLMELLDHTEGNFTPPSKQSIRTRETKVKEKKDKLNTVPGDDATIASEPENFKKKGRKDGHKGSTKVLKPTEHVHDLQLICKSCGFELPEDQEKTGGYQVVEIPRLIPLTTTQYYSYKVNCTNCSELSAIDSHNLKGTIFGPNAVAFLTNLWYTGVVSLAKVGEIFDYLTGELFSESAIIKALLLAAEAVRPEVAKIKEELVDSKHPHLDETSYVHVDKSRELKWIFVIATQQAVVFEFRPDRKAEFLKDEYWAGEMLKVIIPVVDGWRSYKFFEELQRCWGHIIVEARNHAKISDEAQMVHQELRELHSDLIRVRSLGLG
ncbi:MAG: transposase, partial [Candidatus Heimdallarchaeota archaeon]